MTKMLGRPSQLVICGLLVAAAVGLLILGKSDKVNALSYAAAQTQPDDGTKLIISARTGSNAYNSPFSKSLVYIPVTQSGGSVKIIDRYNEYTDTSVSPFNNSFFTVISTSIVQSDGTCSSTILARKFDPVGDYNLSFPNTATTKQTTISGIKYNIYCVTVGTDSMLNGSNCSTDYSKCYSWNITFRLQAGVGQLIGVYAGPSVSFGTGFYHTLPYKNATWSKRVDFAPECTLDDTSINSQVTGLYDLDTNLPANAGLRIQMLSKDRGSTNTFVPIEIISPDKTLNLVDSTDKLYFPPGLGSGQSITIKPSAGFLKTKTYILQITKIDNINKIRIRLPFDQISNDVACGSASASCSLNLKPLGTVMPSLQQRGRYSLARSVVNNDPVPVSPANNTNRVTNISWPFTIKANAALGLNADVTLVTNPFTYDLGPEESKTEDPPPITLTLPASTLSGNYTLLAFIKSGLTQVDCNLSVPVVQYPYLRAYSGDLIAGSGFEQGGVCQTNELAGIRTYLDRTDNDPFALVGSGSQLLATAQGSVTGFRTSTQNGADNAFPQRRVLANTFPDANSYVTAFNSAITAEEDLGGRAGYPMCTADWLADMPAGGVAGGAVSLSTAPAGSSTLQRYNGDTYFTTSGAVSGKYKIYVDGDAYIGPSGDAAIAYNNAGWTNVGNMPSLIIVATGNIYISPRLARFDGVLVANGTLYTCYAEALNAGDPRGNANKDTDVSLMSPNPCLDKRLQINGAVITNKLNLWRLAGTMNQSTPNETFAGSIITAGETIRLTPEFYLSSPAGAVNNPENQFRDYESVNSLPPSF